MELVKLEIKLKLVDARLLPLLHIIHVGHIDPEPDLERHDVVDNDDYVGVFVDTDDVYVEDEAHAGPVARRSILNLVAFLHVRYRVNCPRHLH